MFLLDATYRVTLYSLTLSFVAVRTKWDYQVPGKFLFLTQDETTDATTEALVILQEWNCRRTTEIDMANVSTEEIPATKSVFPG